MNLYDASPDDDVVAARIWWRCDREADEPFPDEPLAWDHIRHLRDTGRMVMATTDDGEPAGFGGVVVRSGVTRLADLFVDPAHQGRGVGKAILREVLGDATVLTTSASNDPRALPLYARAGMQPLWPCHFMLGDPRKVPPPAAVTVERRRRAPSSSRSTAKPPASIERSTTSTTRSVVARSRSASSSRATVRSASRTSNRPSRGRRTAGSS